MRLDLEDFDFSIEYIHGKANVTADALSRIVTTSDELKSKGLFIVNTRSMTRKKDEEAKRNQQLITSNSQVTVDNESDHLVIYTTENSTETRKLPKLRSNIENGNLIFTMYEGTRKNKVIIRITTQLQSIRQTLVFAFSVLEKEMKLKNIKKIAFSSHDNIFEMVPMNMLKASIKIVEKFANFNFSST